MISYVNDLTETAEAAPFPDHRRRTMPDSPVLNARVLIRPKAGFYLLRFGQNRPLVPALIEQLCPMVIPQPEAVGGAFPDDWCRPLDRSPIFRAHMNGKVVPVDRVWTARSLRRVSATEYAFRLGPLREWASSGSLMPESRPQYAVKLTALPSLF
jgi:hypothetical protein